MACLKSLDEQIRIELVQGTTIRVGRSTECEAFVDHPSVSSLHAGLSLTDRSLVLEDFGSTNGTRVNYSQIGEPVYLLHGDTVELGNLTFTVEGRELIEPQESGSGKPDSLADVTVHTSLKSAEDTMMDIEVPVSTLEGVGEPAPLGRAPVPATAGRWPGRGTWTGFWVSLGLLLLGSLLWLTSLNGTMTP